MSTASTVFAYALEPLLVVLFLQVKSYLQTISKDIAVLTDDVAKLSNDTRDGFNGVHNAHHELRDRLDHLQRTQSKLVANNTRYISCSEICPFSARMAVLVQKRRLAVVQGRLVFPRPRSPPAYNA
ncbi:hypothetical protein B0H11DRAFT_1260379 [Mycena galericulata]|nr:hypothetical protein B0H11DRAFT_1260379 [Mycena galericulata]